MKCDELVKYLQGLLSVEQFKDYAPNGLQVEGSESVEKIVTGVTASMALIEAAIERGADTILVHHGYFWKNEAAPIVGMKQARIKALLENNINLLAYHLPLDGHAEFGNTAELGKELGIPVVSPLAMSMDPSIGLVGEFDPPITGEQFAEKLESVLGRKPVHIAANKNIQRIAWVTGGAQNYIDDAVRAGCDAYLSGEISENTTHSAREQNIHYFAAGHHATERYGVKALGEHIAKTFSVDCEFVDIDNPA
jgi:dinuclear metal center YbgI/SA1388 family protein